MSETSWVRIRLESGAEVSVSADFAAATGSLVLDVPATNLRGVPLKATRRNGRPPKPKTTAHKEAAKKAVAPKVESPTEPVSPVSVAGETPEEATA